jgi:hypothetical protein
MLIRSFKTIKLKAKSREWLNRYLPAEITGTVTALAAAIVAHAFSDNHILIAYAGSLGEAIGFYSAILIQRTLKVVESNSGNSKKFHFSDCLMLLKYIMLEFGPAGIIDGLLLRPLFMFIFPLYMKNFTLGILAGKIAGDISFYILVILSYEIIKRSKKVSHDT